MFGNKTWGSFFSNYVNEVPAVLIIGATPIFLLNALWLITRYYEHNHQLDDIIVTIPDNPVIIHAPALLQTQTHQA